MTTYSFSISSNITVRFFVPELAPDELAASSAMASGACLFLQAQSDSQLHHGLVVGDLGQLQLQVARPAQQQRLQLARRTRSRSPAAAARPRGLLGTLPGFRRALRRNQTAADLPEPSPNPIPYPTPMHIHGLRKIKVLYFAYWLKTTALSTVQIHYK